jgi:hypothetical protein
MRPKKDILAPKSYDRATRGIGKDFPDKKEADSAGLIRFPIAAGNAYFEAMPSKSLDLPMQVAKAFAKDMRAFHAAPNAIKRDEIAARQLHALRGFQRPRDKKLRVHDVKEMFQEMKDQA